MNTRHCRVIHHEPRRAVNGAYFRVHHFARQQSSPMPLLAAIAANTKGREGWAFVGTTTTIGLTVVSYFLMLTPNAINGRGDSPDLTLEAAASSPMTLTIMTWAAVVFTPIMLAYTAWTYWVFRRRLSVEHLPARPAVDAGAR
mgnify:CR=1 FL=1